MQMFTHVVDHGGFNRASQALGIPKSTMSRTITLLESQLGVELLRRTTRSVRLTEEGVYYYEMCKRILLAIEEADLAFIKNKT